MKTLKTSFRLGKRQNSITTAFDMYCGAITKQNMVERMYGETSNIHLCFAGQMS